MPLLGTSSAASPAKDRAAENLAFKVVPIGHEIAFYETAKVFGDPDFFFRAEGELLFLSRVKQSVAAEAGGGGLVHGCGLRMWGAGPLGAARDARP